MKLLLFPLIALFLLLFHGTRSSCYCSFLCGEWWMSFSHTVPVGGSFRAQQEEVVLAIHNALEFQITQDTLKRLLCCVFFSWSCEMDFGILLICLFARCFFSAPLVFSGFFCWKIAAININRLFDIECLSMEMFECLFFEKLKRTGWSLKVKKFEDQVTLVLSDVNDFFSRF